MMSLDELYEQNFKTSRQQSLSEVQLNQLHIEKLLEINTDNIPPVVNKINLYADHMINGRWMYNGDTIRVSKDGLLIDGQNRLLAAKKAKVNLTCDLLVGLDEAVFNTIDQGRVRQKGHLVARDIKNISVADAKTVTTSVTRIINYTENLSQTVTAGKDGRFASKLTADKVIEFIHRNSEILDQLEIVKKEFSNRCSISRAIILYLYHLGCRFDEEYTYKYLKKMVLGIGLKEGETLHFFHQILNDIKAKNLRWTTSEKEKTFIKVWSKIAVKGLFAINSKSKIKCTKDEDYVQFIKPSDESLIQMYNS
ncbi:hypothetical protein CF67_15005 (plasmid) [Candidatus Photodesmus blepharus]|uniref:Uncharacterized protein n=1 Tax=Candidatus Photodesmus blepharonis TaxID=1179155 RepID=A0A084CNW5_9GAMM|nr:hypothetical protein [Candidatus Photodesmus blepharus]KEY91494.1 hypothetical protein CF67_15005 [Candidatus Photodesmus blepharus]